MAPLARSPRLALITALVLALVVALVVGMAGSAAADLRVFKATLTLEGILPPPPPIATSFGVANVTLSGPAHVAAVAFPAGFLDGQLTFAVVPTTSFPVTEVRIDVGVGSGMLAGGAGGVLAGPMPVPGNVRLCALGACAVFVDAPLTINGTRGVGIGGTVMGPAGPAGALTLMGGLWQTGMVGIATTTGVVFRTGFAHGPLSATSSTAAPQGVLQLVTPIAVGLSAAPGLAIPIFGVLDVKFLPEPSSAALLGAGAAALAAVGARRARHSRRRFARSAAAT